MAYQNSTQRGPVSQYSSPPGLPGPAPGAVAAGPQPACRLAGRPDHAARASAPPFPGLPVAGASAEPRHITPLPAPARPSPCRSLKRPTEALPTRATRLLNGLSPGPTAGRNRGRPPQGKLCPRCGVAPEPVSRRFRRWSSRCSIAAGSEAAPVSPGQEGLPPDRAFRSPEGCRKAPERGNAWPDLAANRTALKCVACHGAGHPPEGNETRA